MKPDLFYLIIAAIWWFTAVLFIQDGRDVPIGYMNMVVGGIYFCVFLKENAQNFKE
ncbi:MAG: hypothetical protein IJA90_06945 [Peptococcaceae bacterium]|nr:hypothetical protein [Peptococcaceae bacterium]